MCAFVCVCLFHTPTAGGQGSQYKFTKKIVVKDTLQKRDGERDSGKERKTVRLEFITFSNKVCNKNIFINQLKCN